MKRLFLLAVIFFMPLFCYATSAAEAAESITQQNLGGSRLFAIKWHDRMDYNRKVVLAKICFNIQGRMQQSIQDPQKTYDALIEQALAFVSASEKKMKISEATSLMLAFPAIIPNQGICHGMLINLLGERFASYFEIDISPKTTAGSEGKN